MSKNQWPRPEPLSSKLAQVHHLIVLPVVNNSTHVEVGISLSNLPELIEPLDSLRIQRTLLNLLERVLQLRRLHGANDNLIALLAVKEAVVGNPSEGNTSLGLSKLLAGLVEALHELDSGSPVVHSVVETADRSRGIPPSTHASRERRDLLGGLCEEAAGDRGVGLDGDADRAEVGEEFRLGLAADEVVVELEDRGEDVVLALGVLVEVLELGEVEVGDTKL